MTACIRLEYGMDDALPHRLAEIRQIKGVKQTELASSLGISRQQLSNIEAGRREISINLLKRAADSLRVSVAELLQPEDVPHYPSDDEKELLARLRHMHSDPQAVLAAVQGVLDAFERIQVATDRPKDLAGDAKLTTKLAHTWNGLDDDQRARMLTLMDNARAFVHER